MQRFIDRETPNSKMKILIAGDGETAIYLARQLSMEDQDVTVMGMDNKRLSEIDSRYNVMTTLGEATSPSALAAAGASEADLYIAVTPRQNVNIISSQIAREMGARKTVARIDNYEYLSDANREMFERKGVDTMVYPEYLVAQQIADGIRHNNFRSWQNIYGGAFIVASVRIRPGDILENMPLTEFGARYENLHVTAIKRRRNIIIPRGSDTINRGDIVYFCISGNSGAELAEISNRPLRKISNVMIAGAGKIACRLACLLKEYKVTVIDQDIEACDHIRTLSSDITVSCADPSDIEVLEEEGITSADAFVALDNSSEKNIVLSMVARAAGVHFTVADIEDIQYFTEVETLDINMIVNKKLTTGSSILEILLDNGRHSSRCLALEDAEFAEIEVRKGAKVTKAPVSRLSLDHDMTIAGLIRGGIGYPVDGDTLLQAGDRVVVFCLTGMIPRLKHMFV